MGYDLRGVWRQYDYGDGWIWVENDGWCFDPRAVTVWAVAMPIGSWLSMAEIGVSDGGFVSLEFLPGIWRQRRWSAWSHDREIVRA